MTLPDSLSQESGKRYLCNKCGYSGPVQVGHQRPNGSGECDYMAVRVREIACSVPVVPSPTHSQEGGKVAEALLRDLFNTRQEWADAGENDHRLAELSQAYDDAWTRCVAYLDASPTPSQEGRSSLSVEGWQPIETAPKDGREIILRKGDRVGAACWVKWPDTNYSDGTHNSEGGEGWTIGFDGDSWDDEKAPTHWKPLPPPPMTEEQA